MVTSEGNVDSLLCPLCQHKNLCANLGDKGVNKTCWCHDLNIQFPKVLLDQVPKEVKGKACICKQCAEAFALQEGVNKFDPNE